MRARELRIKWERRKKKIEEMQVRVYESLLEVRREVDSFIDEVRIAQTRDSLKKKVGKKKKRAVKQ